MNRWFTVAVASADDIRAAGWAVAAHNDYKQGGESYTFWLFTKDGKAVKGEARTDAEALNLVRKQIGLLQLMLRPIALDTCRIVYVDKSPEFPECNRCTIDSWSHQFTGYGKDREAALIAATCVLDYHNSICASIAERSP